MGENAEKNSTGTSDKVSGFKFPKPGMRIIKTVLSCLITSLIYEFLLGGRNPCFACIGAVYGMGNEFYEGFRNGFNRFVGTLIGGLVIIPFYWLYMNTPFGIPRSFYLAIGVFFAIYINYALGAKFAIQPATVIFFVVLFTQPEGNYITYTVARIIDTGIGVLISLTISMLMPYQPDVDKGIHFMSIPHIFSDSFKAWSFSNHHGSLPKLSDEEREKHMRERRLEEARRKNKRGKHRKNNKK